MTFFAYRDEHFIVDDYVRMAFDHYPVASLIYTRIAYNLSRRDGTGINVQHAGGGME
jgi:hypothetical protein